MDEQTDDPDDAVLRLESALERIARLARQPHPLIGAQYGADPMGADAMTEPHDAAPVVPADEIASRLDHLIDRLRAALTGKSG
ncbi:MAG: hypothetical protein P4L71_14970 [Acetobacteraceae bacterium]|nr:hypothetical protein [Acetobacteraceae bacterium]